MGKYTILQSVSGNFHAHELPIASYNRIADIECDSLEDAFRLSQNIISEGWLVFKSVTPYEGRKMARSTSVGDLIYSEDTDAYYMVEMIGFSEVKIQDNQVVKV
jgi:hypothetical protein